MESREVLIETYERIRELAQIACQGATAEALAYRPESGANSIAWLVWHLTRVQDDHIAEIAGRPQAWVDGWAERFGMEPDPSNTGFGHGPDQVAAIPPDPAVLIEYQSVVAEATVEYLKTVDATELGRIIDDSYDPPVSVGVRLVSVISDNLQHAGQALYLRGMVGRIL